MKKNDKNDKKYENFSNFSIFGQKFNDYLMLRMFL